MIRLRKVAAWLLILQLTAGALATPAPADVASPASGGVTMQDDEGNGAEPEGLRFRLSEGSEAAEPGGGAAREPAPAARLSEEETARVLQRLPPLKADATDAQEFALREGSQPAPRAGATVLAAFPAADERPAPAASQAGPGRVLRYAPEGEVALAPQLSVTFSQPMVAVTSQDEAARSVPVRLTPQAPGRWRWLGTRTLIFDPEGERLPMATEFRAEVAPGAATAAGGALAPASWSFATPPPKLTKKHPEGASVRRDALIFIEFDQRVDAAAVLPTVRARAGAAPLGLRLATEEEIKADEAVKRLAAGSVAGRWLALRAVGADERLPLPPATPVQISVGPGTPSAEGPRRTREEQSFSFRTYGPLRLTKHECGWGGGCTPFDTWRLTFTNPLDAARFDKSQVKIEPEVTGAKLAVYGDELHIEGLKRGRTTYRVTLADSLLDQFGQTLGRASTVTFNVGSADPSLAGAGDWFIVQDPAARPAYSVYTINHTSLRVSLYAVQPEDWPAYTAYLRAVNGYDGEPRKAPTPPGRRVFAETVAVKSAPDELAETRIDLAPALTEGRGHVVVIIEPAQARAPSRGWRRGRGESVQTWVQVTDLALDAFADQQQLVAWATSLKDGRPVAEAEVRLLSSPQGVMTGADGIARLTLPEQIGEGSDVLVAWGDRQKAILPAQTGWWGGGGSWVRRPQKDALRWYVFDDRQMYRPGEEVSVKGWVRRWGAGPQGDVGPLAGAAESVTYSVLDPRGNKLAEGVVPLNPLGGFHTVVKLPATPNLGHATIALAAVGGDESLAQRQHRHTFQIQEFRRPEFEVKAEASAGPHFVGGSATATVAANYYAGGGLPDSEVNWSVTARRAVFTPPNRDDFSFGRWTPWWDFSSARGLRPGGAETRQTFKGRTDAAGLHRLRIDFDAVRPPEPSAVTAQASVTDVNRQVWTATTSMLVHPADLYVGVRSPRAFVQQGEPLVVEAIVADIDGKLIAGRAVRMRAVLQEWVFDKGEWKQQEAEAHDCEVRSAAEPVRCTFTPQAGGQYRVTARVLDDLERPNESELRLWVAGGKQPSRQNLEQERAELVPDRREFRAGETAEVLVQSPFAPAEGVLTLRRSGLLRTERFRMEGASHTLRIPIEEGFTPNVHVQVDLVGAAPRTGADGLPDEKLPKRPAFAKGELNLTVPPLARRLQVTATPREKALEPGAETTVGVEVRDAEGRAVEGSELAVVVVDEAILALTGYRIADPLAVFYTQRGADVSDHHLRADVLLGAPGDLEEQLQVRMGGGDRAVGGLAEMAVSAPSPPSPPAAMARRASKNGRAEEAAGAEEGIRLREDFKALAVFAPSVKTDASGRAEVKVKVPDSLTRYRVMAVSVAGGKQFGAGESNITARMPLMVRPSAPRFLNFGDRVELPVVLQNQTDEALEVSVAVRAANAELTEGAGRRVTVPANDRVEVRFPVAAAQAGRARFQFGAVAGRHADAAQVELPVWTPATTEAFATYGELDGTAALVQPVTAPPNVFPQFGGLEVQTSSTQLQALTDAVLYLVSYPYECSEQLSSRVLAVAALRDVLTAFKTEGMPAPEEMQQSVARDIERLRGMQNDDGGFGFWRRGDKSWPYVSIHVAHALVRAKEKGFDVPQAMLDRSRSYLRDIERRIPSEYGPEARHALTAYALNVRWRMNDRDAARARQLITSPGLDKLSLEAVGWLLPVLSGDAASTAQVASIRRHLDNRAEETAATAHFTTSYGDADYLMLHSSRRTDGVVLEALIHDQPASDLIPKVVRGLLAHRKQGRWTNTQENVFILLALDRYFNTYEKTTPDFVARAWLGDSYAGEQQFRGRSTERRQFEVPMRQLAARGPTENLTLSKEGTGRLYYRVGLRYAPSDLRLKAADYGFTVERTYEGVDDKQDVRRESDGTWRIRSGAKVRVRLTLVAPTRRYHVALTDPLPAGLEALNPALAVTEALPPTEQTSVTRRGWWWWRPWYEHQNLRDERAEAFASLLWEGVYHYEYFARATTPGSFVVPPPKAEEMYAPETFGRGVTDRVVVE